MSLLSRMGFYLFGGRLWVTFLYRYSIDAGGEEEGEGLGGLLN